MGITESKSITIFDFQYYYMKSILSLLIFILLIFSFLETKAQLADGTVAPNFTFTDINGKRQELYAYLDSGKSVVLEISTTWCVPCWNYHKSGQMENFFKTQGPDGKDTAFVLFVEADATTTDDDIHGTGTNTQGDWFKNTPYPICNPPKAQIDPFNSKYKVVNFPNIYMICADTKKTKLLNQSPLLSQLNAALAACSDASGVNNDNLDSRVSVFPSPTSGSFTVEISKLNGDIVNVKVYNTIGDMIAKSSDNKGSQQIKFNLSNQPGGIYFVEIQDNNHKIVKKIILNN